MPAHQISALSRRVNIRPIMQEECRALLAAAVAEEKAAPPKRANREAKKRAKAPKVPRAPKGEPVSMRVAQLAASGSIYDELAVGPVSADTGVAVWHWDGHLWDIVEQSMGHQKINAWLMQNAPRDATTKNVKEGWQQTVWHLAEVAPPKPQPDSTRVILALQGGYLEVQADGQIVGIAPAKEHGLTFQIKAQCPVSAGAAHTPKPVPETSMFGRFLETSMPDADEQRLLQEMCALTFTGSAHAVVAWWHGSGENGKSVALGLLEDFHPAPRPLVLHEIGERFGLEDVVGASLLTVSEVDPKKDWHEERLKSLTGGDSQRVQRKGISSLRYRNVAQIVIAANDGPRFKDKSNGVARRIVPLEWRFEPTAEQKIEGLRNIISTTEAEIYLDWILEGLQRIARRGGTFMPRSEWPASVKAGLAQVRRDNDIIRRVVEENGWFYTPDLPKRPKIEVWNAFVLWCSENELLDEWGRPQIKNGDILQRELRRLGGHKFGQMPRNEVIGSGAKRVPACRIAFGPEDEQFLRAREAAAQQRDAAVDQRFSVPQMVDWLTPPLGVVVNA